MAEGKIPHPKGMISVNYVQENNRWKISIELPKTITGTLVWKGMSSPIQMIEKQEYV